jgi:hypothetical protein
MDNKIKIFAIEMKLSVIFLIIAIIFISSFKTVSGADPEGPDSVLNYYNTTKTSVSSKMINISGGYIGTINITATVKDIRWKAFVGYVSGSFTLDDATGATIYDWSLTSITGRVYATRNSTSVLWSNINCSNITNLNRENVAMNHSNANDNLNMTFNYSTGATHREFYVGNKFIVTNSCPTLNTYVGNNTQDNVFEETALFDGYNTVYATNIEPRIPGFNNATYDFQMIVPENGLPGFNGATAYYIYVEIGT